MLGDAAGFARHHIGMAKRVEQRGLAVVDMAHHGDDRRTRLCSGISLHALQILFYLVLLEDLRRMAELLDHEYRGVLVEEMDLAAVLRRLGFEIP